MILNSVSGISGEGHIAFDRLELDAWVEDYISRNGRPAKRSELWDAKNHQASRKEAASGGSTRKSKDTEDWQKAAARIISGTVRLTDSILRNRFLRTVRLAVGSTGTKRRLGVV